MVEFVMRAFRIMFGVCAATAIICAPLRADEVVTVQLSIKNHRFVPSEISAPAGRPIMLRIKNLDATPAEFESITLRVEKVITGDGEGVVRLRALEPGRYKFFDDFNKETTQGTLVVQPR
jgi:cupredoxin-like protein